MRPWATLIRCQRSNPPAKKAPTPMTVHLSDAAALSPAQQKWRSSGITDDQAKKLGLRHLLPEEVQALDGSFYPVDALKIPYFGLDGKRTKFYRIRYLAQLPGFAGVLEKPQRYAQPPKTLNEIYLAPVLDWTTLAQNTKEVIYITEGELKAGCACVHGLACIGLGGVTVWKSSKREITFLPQLEAIVWTGRSVVICFDSDAATNPDVVWAQIALSRELVARGALVAIAALPPGKDGGKQGLDDYIVANGADALSEVLEASPSLPEAQALWEMNAEVAYIKDPGFVIYSATGQRFQTKKWVQETCANRHYIEMTMKDKQILSKKKPLAPRWVSWELRNELEGIVYSPGNPKIVNAKYNTWGGWGCLPKKGDIGPWRDLLDFIFHSDPRQRKWFEQWCAYPLQHPGSKMYTSTLLWGTAKGTGKTLVAYALMKIYGTNAVEIKSRDLTKNFNSWQEGRQFVYADEITGGQARLEADYIKGLITQHHIKIDQKYIPEYIIDDCINYLFASNHADALFLEDGDRRFFVHEVLGPPKDREFYERIDQWLKGEGPSALFHHLLKINLHGFNPKAHAPETLAKTQMILNGKGELAYWVHGLMEDPSGALKATFSPRAVGGLDLWTPRLLLRACDPDGRKRATEASLGRALAAAGVRQVNKGGSVRTKYGIFRLYAIRNSDAWHGASPKKCSEHYESFMDDLTKF